MKKKLMQLLLLCLATVPATAQTEKSNVLIYTLDGKVDTLLLNNVRDIYHSRRDVNGVEQTDISTLRLRTVGGERVYPLTEIDHVVMPKSRRVVSFKGTALPESETADARQFTSVQGDFPGHENDKVVYKWTAGGTYQWNASKSKWEYAYTADYIFLANGQRSKVVGAPYSNRPNGEFTFETDTLVADEYTIYYPGSNKETFNKVKILDVQSQIAPNNSDHLGLSGDCGWAVATRQPNSDYLFQLNHEVAVLCFIPRVDSLKTIQLKDIAVKSVDGQTIAGEYTLSTDGITLDSGTGKDTIMLKLGYSNNVFCVPNNKEKPADAEWEHTPQDSVAAYMVIAPQTTNTPLKVYYHIYDTESQIDTVEVKTVTASQLAKATVYPITNKLNPRLFFAAFTDSCQWEFGQPAKMFGSVNLPIDNVGFIWGYRQDLDFTNREEVKTSTHSAFPELSFNAVAVDNVKQKAYFYRAYAEKDGQRWFGKVKKFGMDREIVNLGTSVSWSSINMGAITAEDPGKYYAWGELETKTTYTQNTYQYYDASTGYTKLGNIAGLPAYDVVAKEWRGCWRMPTEAELMELFNTNKVTRKDTTYYDEVGTAINGYLFKNKNRPDSLIFLPAAGYYSNSSRSNFNSDHLYWSATEYSDGSSYRVYNTYSNNTAQKYLGFPIRPVFESNHETADGKYFFIRTDSISYSADHTSTNMYGTMRGIDDVVQATDVEQGFVIGTTPEVELGSSNEVLKVTLTQPASDNGSYNIELSKDQMNELSPTTKYYVRSYMTYVGDNTYTWYGDTLSMTAMTIATDSTNWAVGMTTARLCGTVTGITEAEKEGTEIGFVVGTSPDVTLDTPEEDRIRIVCDSVVNNKFVCELDDIDFKQYYYRAYVNMSGRIAYGEPKMLGLEFVDLGLPSGLKWANINIGSQTPMARGSFYAWGETFTRSYHNNNNAQNYSHYNEDIGDDIGGTLYDAAQVNWKGPWRMPSKADFEELAANCTQVYTTLYGKNGYLFTSKIPGYTNRTIFLPATGYHYDSNTDQGSQSSWRPLYWTSTRCSDDHAKAWTYEVQSNGQAKMAMVSEWCGRYGFAIRPVALVNNTLDDESMIQLTTDSVHWEVGDNEATLYGYLLGLRYNPKATESGFVYATKPNITENTEGVRWLKTSEGEGARVANGVFHLTTDQSIKPNDSVYYYRAYVKVDGKYYFANEREFGRRLVNLGLDSHTLWANINLGASSCDDSGDYYAWGETTAMTSFSRPDTYPDLGADIAGSSNDAAHVNWGGLWRLPTRDDVNELLTRCTWTEVTKYDQPMYKVVGPSGDSIFIAKRGSMSGTSVANDGTRASFWTSNLNDTEGYDKDNAYGTSFYGANRTIDAVARYLGYTIRPVIKYTHELADQTKIYLTTDSTNWEVGERNPRLVGAVAGLNALDADPNVTVTRGFVVGYDNDVDELKVVADGGNDQKIFADVTATASATDNTFRGTTTYDKDTTYYYRAYVKIEKEGEADAYYYGNIRRYGLELVEMGNGIIWASLNLGAQISSDYGDRFAWGETNANKSSYTQGTYRYYDNGYTNIGSDISKSSRDAAKATWTGTWRMPTVAEMYWLANDANCTWTWTTEDGVSGYRVTSKVEGYTDKSIFLPAAGYQDNAYFKSLGTGCYYWTSSMNNDNQARYLYGDATTKDAEHGFERFYGLAIRPVKNSGNIEGSSEGITGQHKKGGVQTGDNGGNGSGQAGSGNTGTTIGN